SETEPVKKALRFLFLSNFSLLGKSDTMMLLHSNTNRKKQLISLLEITQERLENCMFRNQDFRVFLNGIIADDAHIPKSKRLIYGDGPYIGTTNNYGKNGRQLKWKESDSEDLFEMLVKSKHRFALSEFGHQLVLDLAKNYKLQVTSLGERRNLENRKEELLITNYKVDLKPKFVQVDIFAST
ncbi:MAG: hypothetical protein AAGJ18_14490, partial [Bacteroidota bacterium]